MTNPQKKQILETWTTLKEKILKFKRDKQERIRILMDQSALWEEEIDLVKKKVQTRGEWLHKHYWDIKQLVKENKIKELVSYLEKDWVKEKFLSDI